jgi:hypothetical protein
MWESTVLLMLQYCFLLGLIKHVFLDGRSDGASTSSVRRGRQKSMSTAPEIGDDFARLVKMV